MTITLYTTTDVAELAQVSPVLASVWANRGLGPAPDYRTTSGTRCWASLDGWAAWLEANR